MMLTHLLPYLLLDLETTTDSPLSLERWLRMSEKEWKLPGNVEANPAAMPFVCDTNTAANTAQPAKIPLERSGTIPTLFVPLGAAKINFGTRGNFKYVMEMTM